MNLLAIVTIPPLTLPQTLTIADQAVYVDDDGAVWVDDDGAVWVTSPD